MSEEAHSPSEEEPTTRPVTTDEKKRIPIDYKNPYYSLTNQRFEATWNEYQFIVKQGSSRGSSLNQDSKSLPDTTKENTQDTENLKTSTTKS
jgi:hypothetical protein